MSIKNIRHTHPHITLTKLSDWSASYEHFLQSTVNSLTTCSSSCETQSLAYHLK